MRIDLNADVGESLGPWRMGDDERLIPLVTSVNVACGAHAGDPLTIRRTVATALAHEVAVGAHPGYPDLVGFGRRDLD
ncbi:MAG TPA: LamB/YcsF family protein, partial [Candidatus Limnocylindrales bacterium]